MPFLLITARGKSVIILGNIKTEHNKYLQTSNNFRKQSNFVYFCLDLMAYENFQIFNYSRLKIAKRKRSAL